MDLKLACHKILAQMANVIQEIPDIEYTSTSETLNGSTLGQHFRHAIEFFECLAKGYNSGTINYDQRDHDRAIETSRLLTLELISRAQDFIEGVSLEKELLLQVSYNQDDDAMIEVRSNMAREIIYNIEHVVHHMALVKIGVKEVLPGLELPHDFGIAASTIKYHKARA